MTAGSGRVLHDGRSCGLLGPVPGAGVFSVYRAGGRLDRDLCAWHANDLACVTGDACTPHRGMWAESPSSVRRRLASRR
jgi:hypothetical protein